VADSFDIIIIIGSGCIQGVDRKSGDDGGVSWSFARVEIRRER